ncbi:MAG: hypothetical protein AB7E37_04245 [Candidatus Altimarinota bacterium]
MDYKKDVKKVFADESTVLQSRYHASKNVFMYTTFLFFLNYFFVGAKFYDNIFLKTLPYMYVLFLASFFMFLYLFLVRSFSSGKSGKFLIIGIEIILFIALLLPFVGISLNNF